MTPFERELVRLLDWRGLITRRHLLHAGDAGVAVGVSNLHIYAAMRGQTLE
jgi:gallate dioxygenase